MTIRLVEQGQCHDFGVLQDHFILAILSKRKDTFQWEL